METTTSQQAKTFFRVLVRRVAELFASESAGKNPSESPHKYSARLLTDEERANDALPIVHLSGVFHLSPLETDILILCFACYIDPKLAQLASDLNGDPSRDYMTPATIERLLSVSDELYEELLEALAVGGALRAGQILATRPTVAVSGGSNEPLILEDRIATYLVGSEKLDLYNRRYIRDPDDRQPALFDSLLHERILLFSQQNRNAEQTQFVYIYGPEGAGHETAAGLLAEDCSRGLIVFRTNEFLQLSPDWARKILKIAARESRLLKRSLFIPEVELILDSPLASILRGVMSEIFYDDIYMPAVVFGGEGPIDAKHFSPTGRCFVIELNVPSAGRRVEIWNELLKQYEALDDDITVDELANRYRFTPGQIETALNFAQFESIGRAAQSGLSRSDMITGCRMSSNRKLTELAKRIENRFTWDDLVLSENLTAQVRGVVRAYRQIHLFFEGWDFEKRFQYGKGVSALFGGASGTGKTMAASVIATELDLELYKIDLSRVVSKFIGETEKNLARIFKEAETSNAILFFDEADALFGKRSEVKDAHDRHANIEINFLLQQMEEYDGLTILATNLSQNIDDAFTRRLQFIINFTKPKVAERERIWRGMFPEKAPVSDDVDFGLLAQNVELAGGGIKNIIFNAGMMALEEGSSISMRHIVRAVRMEYLKENIPFIAANFGPHGQY